MKKFLVLMFFAFFACVGNGYGVLQVKGPDVIATTENVPGKDSFVTEIYRWNSTLEKYEIEDYYYAHIALRVPVSASAKGRGFFSLFAEGDLHKYSSAYHPPGETPSHVSTLSSENKTGIKVGSGWPIIVFSGLKSERVTATGTLVTDTSNKYEIKGKGKLSTSSGGDSGSAGPVGGGTSPVSGEGSWIYDTTSFRVSVIEIRPSRPDDDGNSNTQTNNYVAPTSTSTGSSNQITGDCGVHTIASSESSNH